MPKPVERLQSVQPRRSALGAGHGNLYSTQYLIRGHAMKCLSTLLSLIAAIAASGCQTTAQMMDSLQPQAVSVATRRAQFEMDCPAATGQLISRTEVQPIIQNPRFGGVVRAEYTVGATGCSKRATYLVICPEDGSGCFAAGARNEIR
jgi:hypothetical protein